MHAAIIPYIFLAGNAFVVVFFTSNIDNDQLKSHAWKSKGISTTVLSEEKSNKDNHKISRV